jgi:BMFP domain-containing protein YqiC
MATSCEFSRHLDPRDSLGKSNPQPSWIEGDRSGRGSDGRPFESTAAPAFRLHLHGPLPTSKKTSGARAMSTGPNRILDELAKLMTDAAGAAQGVRREVEGAFRSQAERILNTMDVVQREEFEAVRDMATKARSENQKLARQVEALAARIDALEGGAAKLPGEDPLAGSSTAPKRASRTNPKE